MITWDPAAKDPDIELSNGDLTARDSLGSAVGIVRATTAYAGQKRYFRVRADTASVLAVGLARSTHPLTDTLGASAESWAYWNNGQHYHGASVPATTDSFFDGDELTIATDGAAFWLAINGTWIAGGNPETGANPIFSNLTGDLFPAVCCYSSFAQASAIFTPSASPPAGFLAWDEDPDAVSTDPFESELYRTLTPVWVSEHCATVTEIIPVLPPSGEPRTVIETETVTAWVLRCTPPGAPASQARLRTLEAGGAYPAESAGCQPIGSRLLTRERVRTLEPYDTRKPAGLEEGTWVRNGTAIERTRTVCTPAHESARPTLDWRYGKRSQTAQPGNARYDFRATRATIGAITGLAPWLSPWSAQADYRRVTHGFYLSLGSWRILEAGVFRTPSVAFTEATVFSVRRLGRTVDYLVDGAPVYTSTTALAGPVWAWALLYAPADALAYPALYALPALGVAAARLPPATFYAREDDTPERAFFAFPAIEVQAEGPRAYTAVCAPLTFIAGDDYARALARLPAATAHGLDAPLTPDARLSLFDLPAARVEAYGSQDLSIRGFSEWRSSAFDVRAGDDWADGLARLPPATAQSLDYTPLEAWIHSPLAGIDLSAAASAKTFRVYAPLGGIDVRAEFGPLIRTPLAGLNVQATATVIETAAIRTPLAGLDTHIALITGETARVAFALAGVDLHAEFAGELRTEIAGIDLSAWATTGETARAAFALAGLTLEARAITGETATLATTLGGFLWPETIHVQTALGGLALHIEAIVAPHGATETYAVNLATGAVTRYDIGFEALFAHRDAQGALHYYGLAEGTIYELGGETDDGAPISATLTTQASHFSDIAPKRLTDVFVYGRTPQGLVLEKIADEHAAHTYTLSADAHAGVRTRRIKTGRGPAAHAWALRLANRDGGPFDVRAVELTYFPLSRQIRVGVSP